MPSLWVRPGLLEMHEAGSRGAWAGETLGLGQGTHVPYCPGGKGAACFVHCACLWNARSQVLPLLWARAPFPIKSSHPQMTFPKCFLESSLSQGLLSRSGRIFGGEGA